MLSSHKVVDFWHYLDCWPSGRFCVGFIVPADEQATMIFASLSSLASTPATFPKQNIQPLDSTALCKNSPKLIISFQCILWINSGFSSVPEKIPKKAKPRRRAMSHAVHSLMSLYISTLIAPGGWPALYSASGLTSRITKLFSFCNRWASFTSTLLTLFSNRSSLFCLQSTSAKPCRFGRFGWSALNLKRFVTGNHCCRSNSGREKSVSGGFQTQSLRWRWVRRGYWSKWSHLLIEAASVKFLFFQIFSWKWENLIAR